MQAIIRIHKGSLLSLNIVDPVWNVIIFLKAFIWEFILMYCLGACLSAISNILIEVNKFLYLSTCFRLELYTHYENQQYWPDIAI